MAVVDPLCDGLVMSLFSFFIYLVEKMLGYSVAWSFKYEAPQFSYATSQQTFSSYLNVTHSGNFFMVNDELHGRESMRTDWFSLFYDLRLIKANVGWYSCNFICSLVLVSSWKTWRINEANVNYMASSIRWYKKHSRRIMYVKGDVQQMDQT
ncbi:hypothetical protein Dimus_030231 [Dionaea muscipula]